MHLPSKGTEHRVSELQGFSLTNKTTVAELLESINKAINDAYAAGVAAGRKEVIKNDVR